jgi:hypothetical protein
MAQWINPLQPWNGFADMQPCQQGVGHQTGTMVEDRPG